MASVKKILVTGAGGLLGSEFKALSRKVSHRGYELLCKTRKELDITDSRAILSNLEKFQPDYLINCAAFTNVDEAEKKTNRVRLLNATGPKILAGACRNHGVKLIHFSTHFVFDGKKRSPYVESDAPVPLNHYGKMKLEGERGIQEILPEENYLILRVSWLYGIQGNNFIHDLWQKSKTQEELKVVDDQIASPNPSGLLARKTLDLMTETRGLYHLSCIGSCSRFELIQFLIEITNSRCRVIPISSNQFPVPARRPSYSVLGTEKVEIRKKHPMPDWKEALKEYLRENSSFLN